MVPPNEIKRLLPYEQDAITEFSSDLLAALLIDYPQLFDPEAEPLDLTQILADERIDEQLKTTIEAYITSIQDFRQNPKTLAQKKY